MSKKWKSHRALILVLFSIQVVINWLYIIWIKKLFEIAISSWFLLIPLMAYFYFTFAVISAVLIHKKMKLGLSLGCCVLIFGVIADVLSYNAVFHLGGIYEMLIIPLILSNCLLMLLMVSYQSEFKNN